MNIEEAVNYLKENLKSWKDARPDLSNTDIVEEVDKDYKAIETLLTAYEKEKEKNKKAKEFIKENSHEFHCKRDELIELEFDDNTNATDLIDILDGNW